MPPTSGDGPAAWQARVVNRSLRTATRRSIDRGTSLVRAAARLLERSDGALFTVQDVADEAGQSLRTLYQYFESKDDLLLALFEESMRTYARAIGEAIADLDDPLERLGGGLVAAVRMRELSGTALGRSLARLRLGLSEADPALVTRSQVPLTRCVHGLVDGASAAGAIRAGDTDGATYMTMALTSTFTMAQTLGNDAGIGMPEPCALVEFCLAGLGAPVDRRWLESVDARLRFPDRLRLGPPAGGATRTDGTPPATDGSAAPAPS